MRLFGIILVCGVATASTLAFLRAAGQTTVSRDVTVATSLAPVISTVVVNGGSNITLTANTTTTISVNFTVTYFTGCGHVFYEGNVTTTLYRSGVSGGAACAANTLNCYVVSTSTHNCSGPASTSTSARATSTFQIYYFADATDASSTYPSEGWLATVTARDGSSTTDTANSAQLELNSLLALELATSSLNYGSVDRGYNTTSTNQVSELQNAGNTSSTIRVSGTAFVSGANSFATSSQHYATSTFTFGGAEQALQSAATLVAGFLAPGLPLGPSWTKTTSMPLVLRLHAAVAYNQYLYAIAGNTTGGGNIPHLFFPPPHPHS